VARDYYEVLGVSRDASPDELQRAYRKLARRHHPDVDRSPSAEDTFKEINEAYRVLSDPQRRQEYDRSRYAGGGAGRYAGAGAGRDAGEAGRARQRRAGPGAFAGAGFEGFEGIDIDDLFGGVFGARGAAGPIAGADQEAELEVTVEEAYHGGRRVLGLDGRELEVTIPRGVTDGQRIRLSGQGGHGRGDGQPGDLYLVVRLAPHPRYRVVDRDVYVDLPVAPWEAVLGATVPLRTPAGEPKVTVPPGSSSGRRLRLRGQGLPNPRGTPGDLYAEVRIVVPRDPDPRERELFEELAKVSTFDPRDPRRRR